MAVELERPSLRRLSGEDEFQLGEALERAGSAALQQESKLSSTWHVTEAQKLYAVVLEIDEGMLDFTCSCRELGGKLCRHGVAAALAWNQLPAFGQRKTGKSGGRSGGKAKAKPARALGKEEALNLIRDMDPERLVNHLMRWAKDLPELEAKLLLLASQEAGTPPDAKALLADMLRGLPEDQRAKAPRWHAARERWEKGLPEWRELVARGHAEVLAASTVEFLKKMHSRLDFTPNFLNPGFLSTYYRECGELLRLCLPHCRPEWVDKRFLNFLPALLEISASRSFDCGWFLLGVFPLLQGNARKALLLIVMFDVQRALDRVYRPSDYINANYHYLLDDYVKAYPDDEEPRRLWAELLAKDPALGADSLAHLIQEGKWYRAVRLLHFLLLETAPEDPHLPPLLEQGKQLLLACQNPVATQSALSLCFGPDSQPHLQQAFAEWRQQFPAIAERSNHPGASDRSGLRLVKSFAR